MTNEHDNEGFEHHPLDPAHFDPIGQTRAFRHLFVDDFDDLPLPTFIGQSVLGYVENENVVRSGMGPWYYCDGTVWIPLTGGGLGPFWYDALVDKNWAAEVTAGRGTEGQEMPTFHGHTYRVYSTVQRAIDGFMTDFWNVGAGLDENASILVVPNDSAYAENMDFTAYNGARGTQVLDIWAPGQGKVQIGTSAQAAHQLRHDVTVHFHNLSLGGPATGIFNNTSGTNANLTFEDCVNINPLSGAIDGARFIGHSFEKGWIPAAGEGSIDNITIIGGDASDDFDFRLNGIDVANWEVHGLQMAPAAQFLMENVGGCYFEFHRTSQTAGAVFRVDGTITDSEIYGALGAGSLSTAVIQLNGGEANNRGVGIHCSFAAPSVANATTHFVEVVAPNELHASHIDIRHGANSSGRYLEDPAHGAGAVSVKGVFIDCKFTLVPASIMKVETLAGSSENILDSGVIESGSVGIIPGPGGSLTYLTKDTEASLPNSRRLVALAGAGLFDNGAADDLDIAGEWTEAAATLASDKFTVTNAASKYRLTAESGAIDNLGAIGLSGESLINEVPILIYPVAGHTITIKPEDVAQTAAHRIVTRDDKDLVLAGGSGDAGGGSALLAYSPAISRWRVVATSVGPHDLLDGDVHSDAAAAAVSRGSLVLGNSGSPTEWGELVIGAAEKVLVADGSDAAWQEIYASHIIQFPALAEVLATGVMGARPGTPVGEAGEHGAFTAIRAKAIAGVVGSGAGATTILVEADTTPLFPSPVVLFTLTLTGATEVDDTVLDNAWAAGDIFVRARCTAVEANPPKDVEALFYFKERVENF